MRANVAPEVETNAAESKAPTEKWICVCGFDNFATRQVCFHCTASKEGVLIKVKGVVSRVVTRTSHYYAFIESEEGFFCFFPKKNLIAQKPKERDRVEFKKILRMKGGKRSRAYEVEVISAARILSGTVTKTKVVQTHSWGVIKSGKEFYFFTASRDQEIKVRETVKFCMLSRGDNREKGKGPSYPKVLIREVEAL